MATKTTSFPTDPPYGTTHFEHGRTWEYVEPGMWKSIAGGGIAGEGENPEWDDIENKPSEFPPESHTHGQGEVDGLEVRLDQIEQSITDGGGFVDAPSDNKIYGRKNELWAEVVIPDTSWDSITGKPTEFPPEAHDQGWDTITGKPADYPPSAHNHDGVYQPVGNYIEDADSDGKQYARQDASWTEIVIPEIPEFVETDPTVPDHVKAISTDDIANWSASYSWGDHGDAGYATMMWVQNNYQPKGDYLTEFTETDPVFTASPAAGISSTDISQWTAAHGWGDHASAGYAKYTDNPAAFSGEVSAVNGLDTWLWKNSSDDIGLFLSGNEIRTVNATNTAVKNGVVSLGSNTNRFADGFFSGNVNCSATLFTNGGGWNMSDTTWIRAFGSKAVYVANSGSSAISTAGDVCAYYSDVRLKDVKGQIENPLDKVDAIETFYYTHNDLAKELGYEGDEVQVGVSAQSVKAVMPEVVCRAPVDMDADGGSLTGEDYMTVKYERLVPLLLESIKSLRKEIEALKSGD